MFDYLRVNDPKHQTWGGSHDMVKKNMQTPTKIAVWTRQTGGLETRNRWNLTYESGFVSDLGLVIASSEPVNHPSIL